jgi:hypothetical protein
MDGLTVFFGFMMIWLIVSQLDIIEKKLDKRG